MQNVERRPLFFFVDAALPVYEDVGVCFHDRFRIRHAFVVFAEVVVFALSPSFALFIFVFSVSRVVFLPPRDVHVVGR